MADRPRLAHKAPAGRSFRTALSLATEQSRPRRHLRHRGPGTVLGLAGRASTPRRAVGRIGR